MPRPSLPGILALLLLSLAPVRPALSSVAGAVSSDDPIEWPIEDGGNGHFYQVISFETEFLSWDASRDAAASMSWQGLCGHLATLTSIEENDWVWSSLGMPTGYYLGGFQPVGSLEPSDAWRWVSEEPWSFTNWASGEPNDSGAGPTGEEDGLQFHGPPRTPGTWNDCDRANIPGGAPGFVVEFEDCGPIPVDSVSFGKIKALYGVP